MTRRERHERIIGSWMGHERSPLYVRDVHGAIESVIRQLSLSALTDEAVELLARKLIEDRARAEKYNKASRKLYARRSA